MKDFSANLERIQKGLGKAYQESRLILGVPGISIAVKIDPHYYLAVMPSFISRTAQWAGLFPRSVEQTLIRTGNILTGPDKATHQVAVNAIWGAPKVIRKINAAFIPATFIDHTLTLYGGRDMPMPVTDLRLHIQDAKTLAPLFKGKTGIDKTAFSQQM